MFSFFFFGHVLWYSCNTLLYHVNIQVSKNPWSFCYFFFSFLAKMIQLCVKQPLSYVWILSSLTKINVILTCNAAAGVNWPLLHWLNWKRLAELRGSPVGARCTEICAALDTLLYARVSSALLIAFHYWTYWNLLHY